jgi:pimeloyl-ACP methyl ester carboxylesterase
VGEWTLTKTYPSVAGEVRWQRLGDTDRQPIVLLHGTPFSSFIWRNIAPALAARTHVYVWDIPGYGSSEKFADQDLSLDMLCHVFVELLDHWNLTAPTVVAHDSGGAHRAGCPPAPPRGLPQARARGRRRPGTMGQRLLRHRR